MKIQIEWEQGDTLCGHTRERVEGLLKFLTREIEHATRSDRRYSPSGCFNAGWKLHDWALQGMEVSHIGVQDNWAHPSSGKAHSANPD